MTTFKTVPDLLLPSDDVITQRPFSGTVASFETPSGAAEFNDSFSQQSSVLGAEHNDRHDREGGPGHQRGGGGAVRPPDSPLGARCPEEVS